jgi:hypothetical protein
MRSNNIGKKLFISIGMTLALMFLLPNAAPAQSRQTPAAAAQKSWNAFWAKFSRAVKNKDRQTIIALTSKKFFSAGGETIEEWISEPSWAELEESVNAGTKDFRENKKEIWRITHDNYLLFVYEKKGWRFYGGQAA